MYAHVHQYDHCMLQLLNNGTIGCRLLSGKTSRSARGLDIVNSKPTDTEDLGKRQRRKKKARVASPEPDSASQCNSNGHQSTATVSFKCTCWFDLQI